MPLVMQTKLLRTLQEGTITRLGGTKEIAIDIRFVAATNRDLVRGVAEGAFRRDLYYRLNVIPIHLPSLAERRDDIPALVLHFLNHVNQAQQRNVNLTQAATNLLREQDWPGNIRELSNFIERLVLLSDRAIVDADEVARFLPRDEIDAGISARSRSSMPGVAWPAGPLRDPRPAGSVASMAASGVRPYAASTSHSAAELMTALRQCNGNKSRAAQALGLTVRQFAYRLQKLGAVV
jgi:Nif-specific regulatory protein